MKLAIFHPRAREIIQTIPEDVRRELGKAIFDLQKGNTLGMPLSRPMSSIALGAHELRVKDSTGAYRVFYFLKSVQGIFIFHAFTKKTQKTPEHELALGKKRLKEMLYEEK